VSAWPDQDWLEGLARVIDAPWLLRLPGLGTVVDMV
jgi:hypothetical protein